MLVAAVFVVLGLTQEALRLGPRLAVPVEWLLVPGLAITGFLLFVGWAEWRFRSRERLTLTPPEITFHSLNCLGEHAGQTLPLDEIQEIEVGEYSPTRSADTVRIVVDDESLIRIGTGLRYDEQRWLRDAVRHYRHTVGRRRAPQERTESRPRSKEPPGEKIRVLDQGNTTHFVIDPTPLEGKTFLIVLVLGLVLLPVVLGAFILGALAWMWYRTHFRREMLVVDPMGLRYWLHLAPPGIRYGHRDVPLDEIESVRIGKSKDGDSKAIRIKHGDEYLYVAEDLEDEAMEFLRSRILEAVRQSRV
jgi:hypothetical protein